MLTNVQTRRRRKRPGYTLIELLVVMSIIGVLMGLLLAGVMSVMQARDRSLTLYEIGKLDQGMKVALQQYRGEKTLPGTLLLYNNIAVYRDPAGNGVAAADVPDVNRTKDVLRHMFGGRFIQSGGTVNWDGAGNTGQMRLQGQQCLVFYLGGMPVASGNAVRMTGFSADPTNPTAAGGERIGPFFEFNGTRLKPGFGGPTGFYSYLDPYKLQPYAYFGGTGSSNSYTGNCAALGVSAYTESAGKFMNPTSFQIISAGRDGQFGPGGSITSIAGVGRDDLSNFSRSVLGAGVQQ